MSCSLNHSLTRASRARPSALPMGATSQRGSVGLAWGKDDPEDNIHVGMGLMEMEAKIQQARGALPMQRPEAMNLNFSGAIQEHIALFRGPDNSLAFRKKGRYKFRDSFDFQIESMIYFPPFLSLRTQVEEVGDMKAAVLSGGDKFSGRTHFARSRGRPKY